MTTKAEKEMIVASSIESLSKLLGGTVEHYYVVDSNGRSHRQVTIKYEQKP